MMENNSKIFLPALTGYRAIAAWLIFVLHFFPFKDPVYPDFLKSFVAEFHIGVDMFFVLSGFLITYRYFSQTPIDFKKYMINRFSRIYPVYLFVTLLVFIVFYLQNGIWNFEKTIEAILSLTMTKALFHKYFFTAGISQGWTLTLEELFYITAPFFFILIRKRLYWLIILPILIFVFGMVLKEIFKTEQNIWGFMQKNISYYVFEFFTGVGLALLVINKQKLRINLRGGTYFGIFFILIYLLLLPGKYTSDSLMQAAFAILLCLFGIAPLIWGLIFEDTFIKKWLSADTMVLLGKSSYVFYLIHKGFMSNFIYDHIAENVFVIFMIINVISTLMYKYFEEPVNLWIRRKYNT